ncbi:MAG: HAMP domain-containing sensor histidine kinase, partial [Alphaproteobacteria bacterium]
IRDETIGPIGNTRYREYAGDINESGQHLLCLINDILDLSKVESGTDELYEENTDIPKTVRSIMRLLTGATQIGHVDLVSEVPDGIPALRADARKLKQILVNLLSNAIKFTPAGGKVTLKIWSSAESGHVF